MGPISHPVSKIFYRRSLTYSTSCRGRNTHSPRPVYPASLTWAPREALTFNWGVKKYILSPLSWIDKQTNIHTKGGCVSVATFFLTEVKRRKFPNLQPAVNPTGYFRKFLSFLPLGVPASRILVLTSSSPPKNFQIWIKFRCKSGILLTKMDSC
mgnify:CR=1 FL=1